jgi:RHS repeat-associated protein
VHLTKITDALGQITSIVYNENGYATEVHDPFGRQALFEYDVNGNLTRITDMGGYWSSFSYDANVYLTSVGNQRGTWLFYIEPADIFNAYPDTYPSPGREMFANERVTITNPLGGKEEFFYYGGCDIYGLLPGPAGCGVGWYVSPRHYVTWEDNDINNYVSKSPKIIYHYSVSTSGSGQINQRYYPDGGTELFEFDPMTGKGSKYSDQLGYETNFLYNDKGSITSLTEPLGNVTTYTYGPNGFDPGAISTGLGSVSLLYDSARNLRSVTDRLGNTYTFTYNQYGQKTSVTDPAGSVSSFVYFGPSHQSRYRLKQMEENGKVIEANSYDSIGRAISRTDATGLTMRYSYDNLNRLTAVTYPDNRQVRIAYSSFSPWLIESVYDRSALVTRYEYDFLNRLIATHYHDGSVIRNEYDADGNLIRLIDENSNVTSFEYDDMNRMTRRTFGDSKMETYKYDAAGLLIKTTGARGIAASYTYDANHNRASISYSDGTSPVTYTYDAYNRMVGRTDGVGSYTFAYNANHQLTSTDGPWENDAFSYTYDNLGRLIGIQLQGSELIVFDYDSFWRLHELKVGQGSFIYGYETGSPSPLIASTSRPNGSVTSFSYDLLNRIVMWTDKASTQQPLSSYAYTYDAHDQIGNEIETSGLSLPAASASSVTYQYNNLNQLRSSATPDRTFAYDDDGNMIRGYTPDGYPFSAAFDAESRLKSIDYSDGASINHHIDYQYSGDDFLARMTVDGAETRFIRSGLTPLQERDGSNNIGRSFVWDPFAEGGIGGLLEIVQNGQRYYPFYDGRGNVKGLIDPAQNITVKYEYDPFGFLLGKTGSIEQPYRFSTKSFDEKIGLSYYGYRYYLPLLGRWINRDPLREAGGSNLYNFVDSDPINSIDPWGLKGKGKGKGGTKFPKTQGDYDKCVSNCEKNFPDWKDQNGCKPGKDAFSFDNCLKALCGPPPRLNQDMCGGYCGGDTLVTWAGWRCKQGDQFCYR